MSLLHRLRRQPAAAALRRTLLALLLALGLVVAQAHVVAHEFSHWQGKAPPAESWSCADCLLAHALDSPLTATPSLPPLAQFAEARPGGAGSGRIALVPLLPRARGPPA